MFTRLYLHIPYCRRKCPYCAFYSREESPDRLAHYTGLLLREMELAAACTPPVHPLESIYFGGGTPSLLEPEQLRILLDRARTLFGLTQEAEITLEANPGTVDGTKLAAYRSAGANRLSLGVQSFNTAMLETLGRIHTASQARQAFKQARQAGFSNIGIDLIHALPGQTLAQWHDDLQQAMARAPEHLSIYGLTVEEDTPFAGRYPEGCSELPSDDRAAEMFEAAHELLTEAGYEHYEIANFARPGLRSRHNSGYWQRDGYLGLGAGAHSFLRDTRYGSRCSTPPDLDAYEAALDTGVLYRTEHTAIERVDAMAEFIFLGLRMADGISFSRFQDEFGIGLIETFGSEIATLQAQGLIITAGNTMRLTLRGMLLSNQVFQRFLP